MLVVSGTYGRKVSGRDCYQLRHHSALHWLWRVFEPSLVPVNNKVISGFQAIRRAKSPVAGLEPATEESLQISERTR
ncbi:hypothetical protein PoB_004718000 [Plakobranchus ocellatus]|uniref:Uncharacterized protein n=1 Tax=Plakobranchus ocellatus TaxID=259542 RepID=A0AAV4BML7_9GAST|nr:hypothetical protein PoB_004718000 [Plakobranchus ocellatus]